MDSLFKINKALAQEGQIKGNSPLGGTSGSAEATIKSGSLRAPITLGARESFAGQTDTGFFQQLADGVNSFYLYSIGIAGFLAFGILVYAGIIYIFSAGGFAKQDEAKKWIVAAITGLVLLLCAAIILNFLPGVTKIRDVAPPIEPPKPAGSLPQNYTAAAMKSNQNAVVTQLNTSSSFQTNTRNSIIAKFQKLPAEGKTALIEEYKKLETMRKTNPGADFISASNIFIGYLRDLVKLNDAELIYISQFVKNSDDFSKLVTGA